MQIFLPFITHVIVNLLVWSRHLDVITDLCFQLKKKRKEKIIKINKSHLWNLSAKQKNWLSIDVRLMSLICHFLSDLICNPTHTLTLISLTLLLTEWPAESFSLVLLPSIPSSSVSYRKLQPLWTGENFPTKGPL